VLLVDTTVWIDFFAGRSTAQVRALEQSLRDGEDVCICGVILTEVLQGIRTESAYRQTKERFAPFLFLPMRPATFVHAADLYRTLRRRGFTIRKPIDCMIAAVAIENDVPLLHNDRDFDQIVEYCGLVVKDTDAESHP
jgi:predicted nucleic acid-binding protein